MNIGFHGLRKRFDARNQRDIVTLRRQAAAIRATIRAETLLMEYYSRPRETTETETPVKVEKNPTTVQGVIRTHLNGVPMSLNEVYLMVQEKMPKSRRAIRKIIVSNALGKLFCNGEINRTGERCNFKYSKKQ